MPGPAILLKKNLVSKSRYLVSKLEKYWTKELPYSGSFYVACFHVVKFVKTSG